MNHASVPVPSDLARAVSKISETSYQRGWDDAVKAMLAAAAKAKHIPMAESSASPKKKAPAADNDVGLKAGSLMAKIYAYVKSPTGQGHTNTETAKHFEKMGERFHSVQTSLKRLRKRQLIEQRDGKNY